MTENDQRKLRNNQKWARERSVGNVRGYDRTARAAGEFKPPPCPVGICSRAPSQNLHSDSRNRTSTEPQDHTKHKIKVHACTCTRTLLFCLSKPYLKQCKGSDEECVTLACKPCACSPLSRIRFYAKHAFSKCKKLTSNKLSLDRLSNYNTSLFQNLL